MYVTSKAGTEILKSQYEIIDSINGIPTLETDYSQLKHNHTEPMLMLSPAFNDKYIMVLKEQESVTESSRLRLTGVHSFIYDFSLDRIYEEYTRYFSLENILTLVFSDTEYEYEVSGSTRYNALDFENFGNNDKMSLINQICDRWELEYRVKGNKVYFADQRGTKTTKQFRYKMNIHDSHVNLDISEGATYIRAYFGKKDEENPSNSTYVEKEMLHPLAKDFGVRHAKPYSNEVITQEETMQRYMKMKIEETWKLSVEIDVLDLSGDGSAEVGDEVWAIDERMDLKYKTRIVEKRDYYDVNDRIYRTKVVLGNKTFIEAVSAQEVTAEDLEYEVRRYTNKRIEQLKAEKDNDFNAIRDTLRSEFSDALAQSKIEVAADFDRMEKLLDTKSDEWTEDFNQSVAESKEYAELQAQAKAEKVRTDLETVTSGHQSLIDGLKDSVLDIDTFLGDKSKTLKQQFDKVRTDFGTLQTDLDGVESDLTATKTDLQKQLDEARAELDGLEVGGRNLLPNFNSGSWDNFGSYTEVLDDYKILNTGDKATSIIGRITINVEPNTEYTISSYTDYGRTNVWGYIDGEGNGVIFQYVTGTFSRTFNTGDNNQIRITLGRYSQEDRDITFRHPMLTKGNVKLDWTPAPEDTEEKITTLNQQIELIDGQLSAKLEQTDLLPINNKITEYGNSLTANAQSIESLISKTELHDGDITKWSNQTTANAESITTALERVTATEGDISQAQTDITANADGLSAVINRVNKTETGIDSLSTSLTAEAGKVGALITKMDGHDTQLTSIEADTKNIKQSVSSISADYVKQSSVSVSADKVLIGSTAINGDALSSVISVSPTAIDLISDKINVTGNVNISGGVTALAVDVIEGNFARLFANELTTDVIKSSHIEASISLIQKLFVNSARIDELITQTHFVNEMHALTMDVVDLNASQIRTKILSANTIEAEWLKSGTALLDRVFSSTAMFERMFSKSGFVTSFGSVTISAEQITSGTLRAHNDNFYLNLSTGNMYFRSGANIRFYNEGVAMQHSKLNYTVGMSFEPHPRSAQYPAVWMGGTTSSSVVADHSSFTGIWAVPYNNELDISARVIRIRSGSGYVDGTERLINIKMDNSSEAEIYPSHTASRRYYIGRKSNKFWTVFSQNINGIRFDDDDTYQSLNRGNNGIEFNDSQGLMLIHKGQRYNLDYILNRLAW